MKVVRNAFLLTLSLFLCMGVVKAEGYYTNNNGIIQTGWQIIGKDIML